MSSGEQLKLFDAIATRFGGWVAVAGSVAELVDPQILAIGLDHAVMLGIGGLLLGTGRANEVIGFLKRGFRDE